MSLLTLYEICLTNLRQLSLVHPTSFNQLPISCLRDILPYLCPNELERLDSIYSQRKIPTNDLWRRHFELIWSLSRDDRDSYESILDIPYKRLYFEYLFHDTQILQLGIYTYISPINQTKSIIDLTFLEHVKYSLSRDSIIYCSKRRLAEENRNIVLIWNHQWNRYIKRFILVPNVWNLSKIDPLLIECFTQNVTDIVLSGYPTESDQQGMKFILDVLTRGHISNLVLKFPSYCLLNILSPLLIHPRSYSLSYLATNNTNDSKQSNVVFESFLSSRRRRKLCLEVQIHSEQSSKHLTRVLSTNQNLIEEREDDDDSTSTDTTQAIISDSIDSSHHSFDLLSNTSAHIHPSALEIRNDVPQLILQRHIPSQSLFPTEQQTIESSHLISSSDDNRSSIEPHERLRPYLNRSRTFPQYSILPPVLTPARHLSASEQSVAIVHLPNNPINEPVSYSDSNLFRRRPTTTNNILPTAKDDLLDGHQPEEADEEKVLILHLTPQQQTNSITTLSIYYVSAFERIEMIAIALLGMHQIQHLTLVNFSVYSSELESSLVTLCTRAQLHSLHLTSISLAHGAIGFLLQLYQMRTDRKNTNIILQRLRLDAIKIFALVVDNIHLSDIEQAEFIRNSALKQLIWRERHMQYIHIRLLYKVSPSIMSKVYRLELASILECTVFDHFLWCQTFLSHIPDVRLRNFRIRPINLTRFLTAFSMQQILTVFHFERVGLTWNPDQQLTTIEHAFTTLLLHAPHLIELSLAYNNLNNHFIQWLCQVLLLDNVDTEPITTSWWSIATLNLTFNLIPSNSIRRLIDTLKAYKNRWRTGQSPIRRIDILGNALEMRDIPNLKKLFHALGCDLISYIFRFYINY